jgi:hypothetical protein
MRTFYEMKLKALIFIGFFGMMNLLPGASPFRATRIKTSPVIDGYLRETVWQQAPVISEFKMVEPETGVQPSERTELRILYDDRNLYIGVTCFDRDPSAIAITDLQHDQDDEHNNGNDLIRILLDPFQDQRNAYLFSINAGGARTDGLASGEHFSTNWDGIWDARSRKQDNGWSCEIKIPFKTISFNPALKAWGFNLERFIPRKMETIRLSGISKDSFFTNPVEATLLEGIYEIKQGKGLTFKPYLSLGTSRDYLNQENREWKLNGGFDIYKNFTPNLVGVFTYHTDFAETEVDDRQINLTRFPIYYPEKRSFFLEGSEIFGFQSGWDASFIPFFSRRIGLVQGEQVPIEWGLKLYGKIDRTNIALMNVKTDSFNGIPAENYFAGRIYQNIFSQSKVGIVFTSGDPDTESSNTLLGIDFEFASSRFLKNKNLGIQGWWAYNWNHVPEGRHFGYGFRLDYPNDRLNAFLMYEYFGEALEPGLGFLSRNSIQNLKSMVTFSLRPERGKLGRLFRKISLVFYPNYYWNLGGSLESSRVSLSPFLSFSTESGDRFEIFFIRQREILPESFEVADDVIIPIDDYHFSRYQFNFWSADHRPIIINLEYEIGGFYGGNLSQLKAGIGFSYQGHIKLGAEGVYVRGDLPEGKFQKDIYRIKADFYLNPDLGLMTYIQYDSISETLGANIRIKWRISPGNTIYLVYNRGWETEYDMVTGLRTNHFLNQQDRGEIKLQLSWRP